MRSEHRSSTIFVAGILSMTVIACPSSGEPGGATGGATTAGNGSGGTAGSGGNASGGTTSGSGGAVESGGTTGTSGKQETGGKQQAGGKQETGGAGTDGRSTGGSGGLTTQGAGGKATSGGTAGTDGGGADGATSTTGGRGGSAGTGTCTPSKPANANASGSGPHKVTVETNADRGISEGTIFRPNDLGGTEKYPIFVWGEGGCERNGLANAAAMGEIASHGYFVVADGTPNGSGNRTMDRAQLAAMGAPLLAYIDWAIAENETLQCLLPKSRYHEDCRERLFVRRADVTGHGPRSAHHHVGGQQQRHGRSDSGFLR
jgi:hypothetical protein